MIITKHAKKRMKERFSLPIRAFERNFSKAVRHGEWALDHTRDSVFHVIYHGFKYVVGFSHNLEPILITAYKVRDTNERK